MRTPWGESDSIKQIAPGIREVSTPSHGGIKLDEEANRLIPECLKQATFRNLGTTGWYEEDCDWCIPYVCLSDHFKAHDPYYAKNIEMARQILKSQFSKVIAQHAAIYT